MNKISERDFWDGYGWQLYLDDIRNPPNTEKFVIARTAQEAKDLVLEKGCPIYISFDHDLGYKVPESKDEIIIVGPENTTEETGYDFAKWLIEQDQNGIIEIPEDFSFNVHSANPIGAKNIHSILMSYLKFKAEHKDGK